MSAAFILDSVWPKQVLTSMADANGQISAAVMERLTAAAAAEPGSGAAATESSIG